MKSSHEALEETVYKLYAIEMAVIEDSIQKAIDEGRAGVYFDELMTDDKSVIADMLKEDDYALLLKSDGYSSKEFGLILRYLKMKGYEFDKFFGRVTDISKGDGSRQCLIISW